MSLTNSERRQIALCQNCTALYFGNGYNRCPSCLAPPNEQTVVEGDITDEILQAVWDTELRFTLSQALRQLGTEFPLASRTVQQAAIEEIQDWLEKVKNSE